MPNKYSKSFIRKKYSKKNFDGINVNGFSKKDYRCIVLVARNHGLATLNYLIEKSNPFKVIAIFTHKLNPKSEDPRRKVRKDFKNFVKISKLECVPLYTIDKKNDVLLLENFARKNNYDFLISVSWRYLISPTIFKKARYGSINIHRGDLPRYKGIKPIEKAIKNNEKKIFICAHNISSRYDRGKIISKISHTLQYEKSKSLEQNIERIKKDITPLFAKLIKKALFKKINYVLLKNKKCKDRV